MNTDTYTIARCFAAGGTLAAILAWPMSERYGLVAGVSWLLVALLGLFGAGYDQRVVRRSKRLRRAYTRSHPTVYLSREWNETRLRREMPQPSYGFTLRLVDDGPTNVIPVWTPDSVIADLLIQEDSRRIRLAEESK